MPWKETTTMEQKIEFICEWRTGKYTIKELFKSFESKIDVFICPNIKSFHTAINVPDAPDWVVAPAKKNELIMVSPLNQGSVHTYESLMKAIVHEFHIPLY
jgi:hypothetical protein